MKIAVHRPDGLVTMDCTSGRFRFETEDGIFSVVEKFDGETLRTFISVEDRLIVHPRSSNMIQIRSEP